MSTRLVDLVQLRLDEFLAERTPTVSGVAPELLTFLDYSGDLLAGGKRFRALFCYWGGGRSAPVVAISTSSRILNRLATWDGVIRAATALEIFHAAALVHDDIMDSSDTRRGLPSAHKRFEALHLEHGWAGDAREFGRSSALLLGDLLLAWSDELFSDGLARLADRASAIAGRAEFNIMRTEVTVGQYLDIFEERSWRSHPDADLLPRAHRVIVFKSAKYSVEAPLAIGGSLGGGTLAQLAALREFGLPLGIAYQLRDDLLGVFGDPEVTGKPAGDDLREGKRTVLIALARTALPANAVRLLDELLGDPNLDAGQIRMLQSTIRDSGTIERVERMIGHNVELARAALTNTPLEREAVDQLRHLTDTVTNRSA